MKEIIATGIGEKKRSIIKTSKSKSKRSIELMDGLEADVGVHPILQREEATGDGASAAISHQLQIGPQLSLSSLFAPR